MSAMGDHQTPAKASMLYDPKVRGIVWQAVLLLFVVWLAYAAVTNAIDNLQKAKIASGFGFWDSISGFDIGQRLIDYSAATGTYGRAFWVGLLNTLLIAVIGCILATFLGFTVGIARLSPNWVVRKISEVYVEVIRNVPLLLQLLIWYNAVLKPLPNPRDSISIPFFRFAMPDIMTFGLGVALALVGTFVVRWSDRLESGPTARLVAKFGGWLLGLIGVVLLIFRSGLISAVTGVFALNNRGLYVPDPTWLPGAGFVFGIFVLGVLAAIGFRWWARQQQAKSGQQYPVALVAILAVIVRSGRCLPGSWPSGVFHLSATARVQPAWRDPDFS